jgi:phosphatidylserine synthase
VGILAISILSQTEFFKVSTGAFTDRFETANEAEGGLENVFVDRFLGGMIKALSESTQHSFFGLGIGMGSNVGAQLLLGNSNVFLISEEEWGRIIGEMGPIMGLILIFVRISFASNMAFKSFKYMRKENFLPWMLLGVSFLIFLQGQWAQPTSVGFSTIMGGMMLAGFNEKTDN